MAWPKGKKKTPSHIAAQTAWLRDAWKDPAYRLKQTKRMLGNTYASAGRGIPKSQEFREQIRRRMIGNPYGRLVRHTAESRRKISESKKGRLRPDVALKNKTPEHVSKVQKSLHVRPNRPEAKLYQILRRYFHGEWKYTGDGSVILGGKCPDFTNVNGKKAVIEMYGDYWHRNDDPGDRMHHFAEYGYSCLVIWEHELKTPDAVVQKINAAFH